MNNDDFTVLVSGAVDTVDENVLSEWSNESATNFALSLNIPLQKLFG